MKLFDQTLVIEHVYSFRHFEFILRALVCLISQKLFEKVSVPKIFCADSRFAHVPKWESKFKISHAEIFELETGSAKA